MTSARSKYACRVVLDDRGEVTVVVETPRFVMTRMDFPTMREAFLWAHRILNRSRRAAAQGGS